MSVLELAQVRAAAGAADALAEAYATAIESVLRHPGAIEARILRQVEEPDVFVLAIEWVSVEAHLDFGASPLLQEFRAPLAGLVASGQAAHYESVFASGAAS
jgi:quinol monooxygenase YgiN